MWRDNEVTLLSSRWMLALILGVTILVYAPTLGHWFSRDDFWYLRAGQSYSIPEYIVRSFDFRNTAPATELDRYHPLYVISWRLQYAAFGLHAAYYHAVLLALHLACIVFVWLIAKRLFTVAWAPAMVTLIFAVHPAYADAVEWLTAGSRVFVALPYLASLWFFMEFTSDAKRSVFRYIASLLSFVVAVLMHSSAITLPVVLAAYTLLIAGEPRDALRPATWRPFVPFLAITAIELGVQYRVRDHVGLGANFEFGFHQYTNYGMYLGLALEPIKGTDLSGGLQSVVGHAQLLASLVMLSCVVLVASVRATPRVGAFAAVWLFAAFAPDSTGTFGAFGRQLYVPGPAVGIILALAVTWLVDSVSADVSRLVARAAPFVVAALLPAVLALTYARTVNLRHEADRDERFAAALRRDAPAVPDGGTLYVVGAPQNLIEFDDSRLRSLVQLYYGKIQVRSLGAAIEPQLGPDAAIYRYTP